MYNSGLLKFRKIKSPSIKDFGYLTPIEFPSEIPFEIKRIYYIYGVDKNAVRGNHSHKVLNQVLIAIHGSVTVKLKNYFGEQEFLLDDPSVGLFVGPGNWREMYNFSEDAVLLVLASEKYSQEDYIRDYDNFLNSNKELYGEER